MYSLPKITWIRFGIWLLAGLLIYFLYSVHHSKLQQLAMAGAAGGAGTKDKD